MKPANPNALRRQLLRRLLLRSGTVAVGGVWAYAGLWEPNHPVLESVTLPLPNLPPGMDGTRIAFISDLHIQPGFGPERLAPTLALVRSIKPDLIVLGGDYCNEFVGDREYWLELCAHALRSLSAPLGVYAVFGNHDYPVPPFDPPKQPWIDAGITPLHDEVIPIAKDSDRLFLVGLRSTISRGNRVQDVMTSLPPHTVRIIAQHEPSYIPQNSAFGSVQLSGHTHGGQIVLPILGAPRMPVQSNGYRSGLYQHEPQTMPLYVTRGVGVLPPLLRFNCRPEVTLLTLRHPNG